MDGVCCDWIGPAIKLMERDPVEVLKNWPPGCTNLHNALGCSASAYWKRINANPSWWSNLPEYPWFRELYDGLRAIDRVVFLTNPGFSADACRGKLLWLQARLGSNFADFILTQHKQLLSAPGTVLVDDHVENVSAFVGYDDGCAVLFPRLWNGPSRKAMASFAGTDSAAKHQRVNDIVSLIDGLLAKHPEV
jgi:5'(3')-deoxyribonucleotidase